MARLALCLILVAVIALNIRTLYYSGFSIAILLAVSYVLGLLSGILIWIAILDQEKKGEIS